jgi:hypothetical protein
MILWKRITIVGAVTLIFAAVMMGVFRNYQKISRVLTKTTSLFDAPN